MSSIDIEIAKRRLRVIGSFNDADIQQALDGAELEACRYLNRTQLPTIPQDWPCSSDDVPSSQDPVAADVVEGVLLLVLASYNAADPDTVAGYRRAAEVKLHPYRLNIGV